MHSAVPPAAVVLACTVLALSTAGLGLLVTFEGLAPWNGVALCLMVAAVAVAVVARVHARCRGRRVIG